MTTATCVEGPQQVATYDWPQLIFFLTDFAEALSPKDEAGDKSQATPTSTQFGTQSCFEFGGLSPITPANNKYGLSGGMTLLDLMATPPERKGLLFKVPEVPYVSFAPTEKKVFNDIVENEHKGAQDMVAMSDELNSELKDLAKKYEDKLLEELLKPTIEDPIWKPHRRISFRKNCRNPREQRERLSGQM